MSCLLHTERLKDGYERVREDVITKTEIAKRTVSCSERLTGLGQTSLVAACYKLPVIMQCEESFFFSFITSESFGRHARFIGKTCTVNIQDGKKRFWFF